LHASFAVLYGGTLVVVGITD